MSFASEGLTEEQLAEFKNGQDKKCHQGNMSYVKVAMPMKAHYFQK